MRGTEVFRFLGMLAVLLISIVLQKKFYPAGSVFRDFPLAVLITASAFCDAPALILLSLVAAFFLNWQMALSAEIILLILIPAFCFLARRAARIRAAAGSAGLTLAGIAFFYCVADIRGVIAAPFLFAEITAAAAAFSFVLALFLNFMYRHA